MTHAFTTKSAALLIVALFMMPAMTHAAIPAFAYDDAVEHLQSAGVIDRGDPRVMDTLNRAEALKVLLANQSSFSSDLAKVTGSMPPVALFSDISQTAWYAPYIEVGFAHGIVRGYPDGTFRPASPLRVAEAVALLMRSYANDQSADFHTSPDLPNSRGAWYEGAVSALISQGGVMPTSRLKPDAFITRGELMDMVYRLRLAHGQGRATVADASAATPPRIASSSSSSSTTVVASRTPPQGIAISSKPFAISIPSIGLHDLRVTHPTDTATQKGILAPLSQGVGHLLGYPGEGGKVMIYGHSSDYPWKVSQFSEIFSTINQTKVGDPIYVTYNGTMHTYRITEKKTIPAKDRSPFEPDEHGEELILYTCWPVGSITSRYIVIARPVDEA